MADAGQGGRARAGRRWYQNKPGTNLVFDVQIPLFETGRGTVSFKSDAFFPVDDEGFADKLL